VARRAWTRSPRAFAQACAAALAGGRSARGERGLRTARPCRGAQAGADGVCPRAQNPGVSANILFGRIFNPALTKAIRSNLTLLQAQVTPSTGRRLTADTLVYPNFNTRARARRPARPAHGRQASALR